MGNWLEEIRNSSNEKLLKQIKRGGVTSIAAGKELLSREESLNKDSLRCVIEDVEAHGIREKEVARVKKEAAVIAKEKGLLEESLVSAILDNIDSQRLLESVGREFLSQSENSSNYILKKFIRRVTALKKEVGEILLKQVRETDDLLPIEEELGGPLQIKALEMHWKMGMKPEDFTWLTWAVESLTEIIWERGKKEGVIEKLSIWQLYDIWCYTESLRVKTEAKKKLGVLLPLELKRTEEALEKIQEEISVWEKLRRESRNRSLWSQLTEKLKSKKKAREKIEDEIEDLEKVKEELFKEENERMEIPMDLLI